MERWVIRPGDSSLVAAVAAVGWYRVTEKRAARQRAAMYDETPAFYRRTLPLGTTREAVDTYLRRAGKPVLSMCCMATTTPVDERVLDILTRIGAEPAPFLL